MGLDSIGGARPTATARSGWRSGDRGNRVASAMQRTAAMRKFVELTTLLAALVAVGCTAVKTDSRDLSSTGSEDLGASGDGPTAVSDASTGDAATALDGGADTYLPWFGGPA